MENQDVKALLNKYLAGECSPAEAALLETWYLDSEAANLPPLSVAQLRQIADSVPGQYPATKVRSLWPRIAAAALILICFSVGGYWWLNKSTEEQLVAYHGPDLLPGGNRATLTLSGGKKISLADVKTGIIAAEGQQRIVKAADGTISYTGDAAFQDHELVYNTVTTPRGGQWTLILPDGSKVMLDAASSITYPVAFTGKERKVEVTGQAYFEVVHNAAQPFKVSVKEQIIEDIGTQFNINAYDDEDALKTTLVEGSVRVRAGSNSKILGPGEQSILGTDQQIRLADHPDVSGAVAWKNGQFNFDKADIKSVMRQLSRWYDVDVAYEGQPADRVFSGGIYRNVKISKVIDLLAYKKIHLRVEGKKIIVMP